MKSYGGIKTKDKFDQLFEQILIKEYQNENYINICNPIDDKEVYREFRKILDKIAIKIILDNFENEELVQAILGLSRSERIIIVFNVVLDMNLSEVAFLLGSKIGSTKVQKCSAMKKIKKIVLDNNLF